MRGYLAILLACLMGCSSRELSGYHPLTRMAESSLVAEHTCTTIFQTTYVHDFASWDKDYADPVLRAAILRYERVHCTRQNAAWFLKYETDAAFRLEEEKLGWAEEIKALKAGLRWTPDKPFWVAQTLSSVLYKGMVTYQEAMAWVQTQ